MNTCIILVIVLYTAAGIPDYRSANGLLATVKEKYKVDNPEDVFSHIFFVVSNSYTVFISLSVKSSLELL